MGGCFGSRIFADLIVEQRHEPEPDTYMDWTCPGRKDTPAPHHHKYHYQLEPHKAVAEVSKIGNL